MTTGKAKKKGKVVPAATTQQTDAAAYDSSVIADAGDVAEALRQWRPMAVLGENPHERAYPPAVLALANYVGSPGQTIDEMVEGVMREEPTPTTPLAMGNLAGEIAIRVQKVANFIWHFTELGNNTVSIDPLIQSGSRATGNGVDWWISQSLAMPMARVMELRTWISVHRPDIAMLFDQRAYSAIQTFHDESISHGTGLWRGVQSWIQRLCETANYLHLLGKSLCGVVVAEEADTSPRTKRTLRPWIDIRADPKAPKLKDLRTWNVLQRLYNAGDKTMTKTSLAEGLAKVDTVTSILKRLGPNWVEMVQVAQRIGLDDGKRPRLGPLGWN